VPELVRAEHDLPTLRVHVAGERGEQLRAVFEVVRGPGTAEMVTQVPTLQLGLPNQIRSAEDVSESGFVLDADTVEAISSHLWALAEPDVPAFWLELPPPRGYLQLLPWEKLISPVLGRPLLRLPNSTLRPTAPGPTLRVLIVAGRAAGTPDFDVADLVARVAGSWTRSMGHDVLMDVFVDAESFPGVRDRLTGTAWVTLHDPARAPVVDLDTPSLSAEDDRVRMNPWSEWVTGCLRGKATDVVHILCHGQLAGDRGALHLPASPAATGGERSARVIDAVQLNDAMSRLGAWSLLIGAVPRNTCRPGLRALADDVSQSRAGVVLLHDMTAEDPMRDLDPALDMVFGGEPCDHALPGITCWSHPAFVSFPEMQSPLCGDDGTSTLIAGATQEVLAGEDTPAWVAAGARALETLQSQWTPSDGSAPDAQSVAALQALSKLFEDHVKTFALPDEKSDGTTPEAAP
jgi:hypothetical protein